MAPLSAEEISVTGKCQLRGGLQHFFRPPVQIRFGKYERIDVVPARLVDGHADRRDVIEVVEELQCAEGVAHELRILRRADQYAHPVFVIANPERAVADDQRVRRTEAVLHPAGKVDSLFDEHDRIGAGLLSSFHLL